MGPPLPPLLLAALTLIATTATTRAAIASGRRRDDGADPSTRNATRVGVNAADGNMRTFPICDRGTKLFSFTMEKCFGNSDCGGSQHCNTPSRTCFCAHSSMLCVVCNSEYDHYSTPDQCSFYCEEVALRFIDTLIPLALGTGACIVVASAAVLMCKILVRRSSREGDEPLDAFHEPRDNESVSSMQRWINERLRQGPPRYDTPNTTPTWPEAEIEKPPTYDEAVQTVASEEPATSPCDGLEQPPPNYDSNFVSPPLSESAENLGFGNPGFVGDEAVFAASVREPSSVRASLAPSAADAFGVPCQVPTVSSLVSSGAAPAHPVEIMRAHLSSNTVS